MLSYHSGGVKEVLDPIPTNTLTSWIVTPRFNKQVAASKAMDEDLYKIKKQQNSQSVKNRSG